ncbi:hypothetical protein UCRPA7_2478 [Phaeoacremonium minimum UCRPA7]|uniref:Uncharacterized protein n=1 Tax=Phaeoacremonium minimum (strain UCR-PA7) TaxID=1286976 RepID=R8BRJ4_PHAM7|nr:hypothetical protein UCRPA7_2478 [Phaeoacremonium minimum UCRPA7]EOO01961.1 hypothetical protein UCRPA7_2478 [Phaeoacremonium minimum UCRPA7]
MVRKAFRWRNQSTLSGVSDAMNTDVPPTLLAKRDREAQRFNEVITLAYSKLKDMFEKLRTPAQPLVVNATEVDAPALLHTIRPQHIHVYLRTAAMFRDVDEVIRVMDWVLQAWELDSVLEDAKSPDFRGQYSLMARVFAFFRAYGDKYIEPEVMSRFESQLRELNEQKGCTWHWPSDEEVEEYNAFAFSEEGLPSLFDDPYLKQAGTSATDLVRGAEVNKPNDDNLVDTGAEEGIEDEDIENRKDQDLDEFEEEEEEEDVDDETLAKKQKFGSRRSSRQRRRKNK